jgi:pyroglutamyl-peptidase
MGGWGVHKDHGSQKATALLHNAGMTASSSATALPSVLLTGFDPFGDVGPAGLTLNPSWMAVKALQGKRIAGHRVIAAQLPTVFGASALELMRLLKLHKPALVICVGQAGGRSAISLERVAINVNDARIPDNTGGQPIDTPVVPDGPAAYFGTPAHQGHAAGLANCRRRRRGVANGGHLCLQPCVLCADARLTTQRGFKRTRGGFIHVPYVPEQVAGKACPACRWKRS